MWDNWFHERTMLMDRTMQETLEQVKTPAYVVDIDALRKNLEILKKVRMATGAHILLAQKAFSMYSLYPLIGDYLDGTTASGLYEARLGYEEMNGKEVHVFAPAFKDDEMDQLINMADHIVFNSPTQWEKHKNKVLNCNRRISCGLRVNPEYSEIDTKIYDPCDENSRLGIKPDILKTMDLTGIEGIHFHTMCEQGSDVLERTIKVVDEKFGFLLPQMKWINFGGGHHITRDDYDIDTLIKCIKHFQDKYNLTVYLEPGEAIALNAGYLVSTVEDIIPGELNLAILDTSAACHMPDVLEMPYRPMIVGSGELKEKPFNYRFGGPTCLAGDIIGEYSFDNELKVGDKLIFLDMAIYSMVKNNTFNGRPLPDIDTIEGNKIKVVKQFGYEDFKGRL